ncbi:phosphotransferase family protein [Virgibacillus xinjiangensis]|uniref:Phosphotransferase family protein n=1 Tax=Virgibacillus xinjiangensis TaxID=393090 RepID=A0ABV7D024_9BACI
MSLETIPVRKGEELNQEKLEAYLRKHIPELPDERLEISQFRAGRSNLTYQLQMGSWEAVLRRPPLGPVAPKAHDMEREFTIIKEIHPHFPPAPKPYLFSDEHLLGSPFFIMERKHGRVLDTSFPEDVHVTEDLCRNISQQMIDNLVALHDIDYSKMKLKEMTKPEGFMERQVHGWIKRYDRARTDDIKGMDWLKKWLVDHIPVSPAPTVIHYDFKLNNAMFNEDFSDLIGLFDWEMTTVGDPLADLAVSMSYWTQEGDSPLLSKGMGEESVTVRPGFMTRAEFMEAYAAKSGRDVSHMDFYLTFAYFKLAVICQQIYYRWRKGQTQDERFAQLDSYVHNLIQYAQETAGSKI